MIEAKNIIKKYGAKTAVDGVSFSVNPGEIVGLLGPNGAGKTTTLRVLTGFLPPTDGTANLGGCDILENSLGARGKIGYLPETNPLYEQLSVLECLEFFADIRGLKNTQKKSHIRSIVDKCALQSVITDYVGHLSKGYRQRLGLGIAILHDPEILILDEPTSALDPIQQREVRELIIELKTKKTVLLSTHILSEAQAVCDRLLIIHKGKIVANGTPAELEGSITKTNIIYVRLKAEAGISEEKLKQISGLLSVQKADELEEGCAGFNIETPPDLDPREQIFSIAKANNFPIMELRRKGTSLEDIFHKITSS